MTEGVRIEVCEKHGLRYNAAASEGCARCAREATPDTPPRAGASAGGGIGPQLAIAIALIFGSGFLFFSVHNGIVQPFAALLGGGNNVSSFDTFDLESEGIESELEELRLLAETPLLTGLGDDEELEAMIEELQDPAILETLSEEEISERIEAVYERAWGGNDLLD